MLENKEKIRKETASFIVLKDGEECFLFLLFNGIMFSTLG
jgi:hypothetical protein